MRRGWNVIVLFALSGCGAEPSTPSQSPSDASDGFSTAPHAGFPRVSPHTGTVLDPIKLVTITFANDGNRTKAEQLGDDLVASKWLTTIGADYGVSSAVHLGKIELSGNAPAAPTDGALVSSLWQWIGDGTVPSDPDAFYMIYYPSGTIFDSAPLSPGVLCKTDGAYHWNAESNGKAIAYGVYVDCGAGWDPMSYAISHELAEAATDPYGDYRSGFYLDVPSPDPWAAESGFGGEVSDLCESAPFAAEDTWQLARVWSNSAADAGTNPCVPSDGTSYGVSAERATMPTVTAGSHVVFTLTGWSTVARDDWDLTVGVASDSSFSLAELEPQLSRTSVNNAQTGTLTLTVPEYAPSKTLGAVHVVSSSGLIWPLGFIVQ